MLLNIIPFRLRKSHQLPSYFSGLNITCPFTHSHRPLMEKNHTVISYSWVLVKVSLPSEWNVAQRWIIWFLLHEYICSIMPLNNVMFISGIYKKNCSAISWQFAWLNDMGNIFSFNMKHVWKLCPCLPIRSCWTGNCSLCI